MTPRRVGDWLDIRPGEGRLLGLSVAGAFLVMSFVVVAKALREGFYYGRFDAATMPYITAATVVLGLPAAAWFGRILTRTHPVTALRRLAWGLSAGLALLYSIAIGLGQSVVIDIANVLFYLGTAIGALLIASGFWLAVAEMFVVREAKRLFGLISAGGTMGTLVAGVSLAPLLARTHRPLMLVPVLVAILLLSAMVCRFFPADRLHPVEQTSGGSAAGTLARIWESEHLRAIALIVLLIGVATTLIDYQFKEMAQVTFRTPDRLAGFFGAVYGWTGGLALLVQLLLTTRVLASGGVAWSLAILPLALLAGSAWMMVFPGIVAVTFLKGSDNTLRKSLFRSVMEFLWVPVAPEVRRRTKTFIDSIIDSAGEGLGALAVFLWVTLSGFPSRYLSAFAIVLLASLLYLARRMGREYFATLRHRLAESGQAVVPDDTASGRRDLVGATITRLDITRVFASAELRLDLPDSGPETDRAAAGTAERAGPEEIRRPSLEAMLASGDPGRISAALDAIESWGPEHTLDLIRLLARDRFTERAAEALAEIGAPAVPHLAAVLGDEGADFVIRRRVPGPLAKIDDPSADEALVRGLSAGRFEVRYRAALALQRRRRRAGQWKGPWREAVWEAVRAEVSRERPVWELARLLDGDPDDAFVERRVGLRGELSLEHTFRLLSLVLDPEPIRTSYRGIVLGDPEVRSFALEYLEQVLPADVRRRLWPFVGDLSASQERRALRELDSVVSDLLRSGATLFGTDTSREALRRVLGQNDRLDGRKTTSEEGTEDGGGASDP